MKHTTYAKTYDSVASPVLARTAPTQSISEASRLHRDKPDAAASLSSRGRTHTPTSDRTKLAAPARLKADRHPEPPTNTPPRTRPREKPMGPARPRQAKPRLRGRPGRTLVETMEMDDGTMMALATPCRARKATSSPPVRARPQARDEAAPRSDPATFTRLAPAKSAADQAIRRLAPAVRLKTDVGQTKSSCGSCRAEAMVGRPTTMMPLQKLLKSDRPSSCAITIVARVLESAALVGWSSARSVASAAGAGAGAGDS